jgi:5-methyltetrahydrofolate--homocysteine methyltransferase
MRENTPDIFQPNPFDRFPKPLIIGERANASGSKKFRQALLADDFERMLAITLEQERHGADILDICLVYGGRDEVADFEQFMRLLRTRASRPLMIDSINPLAIAAALREYGDRAIVNSVNFEDGGKKLEIIVHLARTYGAAIVALTIDEAGLAKTVNHKIAAAAKLWEILTARFGFQPGEIIFDPLTFPVGRGDETRRSAARETIAAIRQLKREFPGSLTLLGVSNISYGLPSQVRPILNSVFLAQAIEAGLDMAIISPRGIIPQHHISLADQAICRRVIDNDWHHGEDPILAFLRHYTPVRRG